MSLGSMFFTNASLSSIWTSNCINLGAPKFLLRTLASTNIFRHHNNAKQCRSSSSSSSSSWKKNNKRWAHCSISAPREVATTSTASSFNGYSDYNRLLPCPTENGPPRVEHLVVSEGGPVLDYICKVLDLPSLLVADLIHFGAVYYALVCPKPPPSATPEQIRIFKAATAPSVLEKRTSIKGKTVREAQKTFRITHIDEFVEAGTYLRVHVHPKRFPRYSGHNRLLPCPTESGPPRVEHLVVSEGGPVSDYICKVLDLPSLFVADLVHFGAVYYALVSPELPPSATPEQIRIYKATTTPSFLAKRTSIKGKTVREAQNTFRITHVDEFVEAGTYLRVHVHPKRFPRCYEIDWKSRILAVAESYVVLDKPAGNNTGACDLTFCQVGGTTDNIEESCVTFATRALGFSIPLKTTHQIDNCTEGCVVLARTKEYCSVFHEKIREKKVKKLYLALAAAPMPTGIVTHFMRPINMAPRIISKDFVKGWHMCQLEILECKEVMWPTTAIEEKYCIEDCGWPSKDFAYECKINLLTGKTHQIRTQLAAHGAPIVGDSMYMPAAIAEMANPGLNPFGNHKKQHEEESEKTVAVDEWIAQHGKEPSISIGLQACQISWDDGEHFYEAGSPWWRLKNA